jgi:hypothetical protein
MKKIHKLLTVLTLSALTLLSVVGCGANNTDNTAIIEEITTQNSFLREGIRQLSDEILELQTQLSALQEAAENSADEMMEAMVTGSFVATVRHIMPDFVFDERPRIAVLTEFQSGPVLFRLDPEIISQLEIGKTYVFEVEDTPVGKISMGEYGRWGTYALERQSHLNIRSIRLAEEHEKGVTPEGIGLRYILTSER